MSHVEELDVEGNSGIDLEKANESKIDNKPENNTEKKTLSKVEVQKLVEANIIPVIEGSRCVDGRYDKEEGLPAMAKPGADAGSLMAVLAGLHNLDIDITGESNKELREKILEAIVDVVGGPTNFNMHTDDHHTEEGVACGCGHVAKARLDAEAYGMTEADISILDNKLEELKSSGANEVVLNGSHGEGAVVVLDDANVSIAPKYLNTEGEEEQVFVYHKALDEQNYGKIADSLSQVIGKSRDEIFAAITSAANKQVDATLARLANGLPIYEVGAGGVVR